MNKNNNITIGMIGGGMMAQIGHLPFYIKDKRCNVKSIVETRPSLIRHLKNKYEINNIISDYNDVLMDPEIDSVVISVPREATGPITFESLKSGKNVMSEKPMAHTVLQANKLIKQAELKKLIYGIGFMKRYDLGIIKAKESFLKLKKSKRLGNLLFARFYNYSKKPEFTPPPHQRPSESRKKRLNIWPSWPEWVPNNYRKSYAWFLNVASHDINLMHYFFQDKLHLDKVSLSLNGSISASFKHENSLISFEFSNSNSGVWMEGIEFIYEKGRLVIDIPCPMNIRGVSEVILHENIKSTKFRIIETQQKWMFDNQAKGFINAILGKEKVLTSGDDGLRDIKCIENIWKRGLSI